VGEFVSEGGWTGFGVLGPLQVLVEDEPQALGGPKQRAILALLLLNRNRVVPMDAVSDTVWEDNPPPAVVSSIHVAISGLRRVLAPVSARIGGQLETAPPGYRLSLGDDAYDLALFQRHREAGGRSFRAGDFAAAAAELNRGLALWRGQALADLSRIRFASDFAAAVEEERLTAVELRVDADLRCGRLETLLPELLELTARHTMREHLWAQLATVLYGLNRQAEALSSLRRLREVLDEELGIDPSPSLQELELRILRQDLDVGSVAVVRADELAATVGEPLADTTAELVCSWGPVHPVFARGVIIGRSPDSDIVVADDRASRQHAQVSAAAEGFTITDLRSRNGTYLNGRRVVGEVSLSGGDVIGVGRLSLTLHVGRGGP
jgi:DNA-binding SARP family transcriptional activator